MAPWSHLPLLVPAGGAAAARAGAVKQGSTLTAAASSSVGVDAPLTAPPLSGGLEAWEGDGVMPPVSLMDVELLQAFFAEEEGEEEEGEGKVEG
jgi:hypothetical protein